MKRSKAERKLREYLQAAPFTMWGDYEIAKPDRLEDAVQWCVKHLMAAGLVHDKEPQEDSTGVVMTPLGPIYPEPKKRIIPEFDPAWLEAPPVEPEPEKLAQLDSGFVTYKGAVTCTCQSSDLQAGHGYQILNPDCPIHGPHAFPWRKSR